MKTEVIARHADGIKSKWQVGDADNHYQAIETVTDAILRDTGAKPRVVLALITGGKP